MSESEKNLSNEAKQRRSPRFPVLSIDEAVDRARRIYRQDKQAFTTLEAIKEHMGYTTKGKGGRAGRAAAALKQYGLLDERGGRFRVSDLAFKILERAEDAPERTELIRKAAMNPPIIRKVFKHYGGELPSDTTLRDYLLFDEGFNPDSARDFIRILRRTKDLVNPTPADYNAGEESEGEEPPAPRGGTPPVQATTQKLPPPTSQAALAQYPRATDLLPPTAGESLDTRISDDCKVRIFFDGPVTQEAIAKLKRYLELIADDYPTKEELEPQRPAKWNDGTIERYVWASRPYDRDGAKYVRIMEDGDPNEVVKEVPARQVIFKRQ